MAGSSPAAFRQSRLTPSNQTHVQPYISQHSPRLYRLGKHYGKPMMKLADQLIAYGLSRLDDVFPDKPASEMETLGAESSVTEKPQASLRASRSRREQV